MTKPVIIVTEPEYRKATLVWPTVSDFTIVACSPDEKTLANSIIEHNAIGCIIGPEPYKGPLYKALPVGGVVARFGVGCDGVDLAKASEAGLYVTNTPGVLDNAVAEHAMALVLASAKHLGSYTRECANGEWRQRLSTEVRGRTLAVVGLGAIGRRMATMASRGFGMRVLACDAVQASSESLAKIGVERSTCVLEDVLSDADFVSLHIPGSEENRHFVNTPVLQTMQNHAVLVNTARGSIVDENALFDALANGEIGGAALDVFENEPYSPVRLDKDLRKLPNVVMTPHVASNSVAACQAMARRALNNIRYGRKGHYETMDSVRPRV